MGHRLVLAHAERIAGSACGRLVTVAAVKVPDRKLHELREQGFTIVEGFLAPDELGAAQEALWLHYPRPEEYFADPSARQEYARSQFAASASCSASPPSATPTGPTKRSPTCSAATREWT
jgi:hypothetical protein